MLDSAEQIARAEFIIILLAKLYVVLELSPEACPVCQKTLNHEHECPIELAWSLLDEEQQREARHAMRAFALSLGCDDSFADPVTH
jgi:hypothetical protein